ncbi:hypothetical protein KIW84_024921 [Lathyrus oleraceus]|uniref:Uncharacterized protein n=1 Tax=Pisum sativum TaxID=3888 RepID=A0A9D5BD62_PEA|nr:hypothetical protein KIW84_024921 [Pisum sativum]
MVQKKRNQKLKSKLRNLTLTQVYLKASRQAAQHVLEIKKMMVLLQQGNKEQMVKSLGRNQKGHYCRSLSNGYSQSLPSGSNLNHSTALYSSIVASGDDIPELHHRKLLPKQLLVKETSAVDNTLVVMDDTFVNDTETSEQIYQGILAENSRNGHSQIHANQLSASGSLSPNDAQNHEVCEPNVTHAFSKFHCRKSKYYHCQYIFLPVVGLEMGLGCCRLGFTVLRLVNRLFYQSKSLSQLIINSNFNVGISTEGFGCTCYALPDLGFVPGFLSIFCSWISGSATTNGFSIRLPNALDIANTKPTGGLQHLATFCTCYDAEVCRNNGGINKTNALHLIRNFLCRGYVAHEYIRDIARG